MAILGYSGNTTTTLDRVALRIGGGIFTAPVSGTLGLPWVLFGVDSGGAAGWYVVVYAVTGTSTMGAVVGKTTLQSTAAASALAWRQASAWDGSAPTVTAGTKYSLQVFTPSDARMNLARTLSGGVGAFVDAPTTAVPDPYTAGYTVNTSLYRVYCTITEGNAPTAPTKVSPSDGASLNPAVANVFSATYNGDGVQTGAQYRYRDQTVGSWTTGAWEVTPYPRVTIPGATFSDATDYYVQVRYRNAYGDGAWSDSWSVSAVAVPDVPVITSPSNLDTISTATGSLDWTVTNQDAYRVQVFADNGSGGADEETSLYDSDVVETAGTRTVSIDYSSWNGDTVHPAVAVRYSSTWSSYATVAVDVAFTGPMKPTCVVTVGSGNGIIAITATHPTPTGGEPAAVAHDIYRTHVPEHDPTDYVRIAASVAPGATYNDREWVPGIDYAYKIRALAADGTSTLSDATT